MDTNANLQPVICEVCGSYFESRRGLSSHARLHLRQLGVALSESTQGPIELLYQIIRENDGSQSDIKTDSPTHALTSPKHLDPKEPKVLPVPKARSSSSKAKCETISTTKNASGSLSSLKKFTASPLHSSSSPKTKNEIKSSTFLGLQQTTPKPIWAPQETDSPITLASNSNDEVHVCQVCGAWYETRKGLSSHARAHLRQLGVPDANSKISPIDLLYQIKDIRPAGTELQEPFVAHTSPKSLDKHFSALPSMESPSSSRLQSPPSKRAKVSEKVSCVLCGDEFENRKGLASHARSHLRQIGVSDLLGKSTAIDAVEELAHSGMLADIWPMNANGTSSSGPAQSPTRAPTSVPSLSPLLPHSFPANGTAQSSQGPPVSVNRAPKAKKGFRLAVDPQTKKPKLEPIDKDIATSLAFTETSTDTKSIPLILCDFCGQLFDTRKALSCHARAHLRQLGISWSSNTSPIDLLKELMAKDQKFPKDDEYKGGSSSGGPRWDPKGHKVSFEVTKAHTPPLDFSISEKSSPGKRAASQTDTSCELCGFEFDHRKALASHARAHLRQLGVTEWKADGSKGSPIEILSEWIQKEPGKVAEITQRYRMGDLYIKKSQRPSPSPCLSTETDSMAPGTSKHSGPQSGPKAGWELMGDTGGSSKAPREQSKIERGHIQKQMACRYVNVPSPNVTNPPKQQVSTGQENPEGNPQQQSRAGNIPALLPNPPLTPLVKLVGKVYSLKCRFCDEVFCGPLSIQEDWIAHLQEHILKLGYKGKASLSPTAVTTQTLIDPVAV